MALAERIQEKLERIVREKKTTAACAAVCGPEGLLAAACAGTRGFEDSPARVDDLYNIGSVSKIYVTAAVMKLVEEGRISLDEPVQRYLPDWRLADESCGEITVRMLLNHSSGIPGTNLHDHLDLEEEEELYTGKYRNTPAYWRTVKLRARPGSFSGYCNDGFDLAAEVVEAVTGKPYIQWLREQITGPAGAFSAGVGRRLAEGHVKVACRGSEPEYYNCFGAGAIHTTVPECAMFGSLFIDSMGIIGQAYLDETRRPQGATFLQGAYDATDYCLGWDSLYNRNRIPLGEGAVIKSGGTEQFTSYLLVGPARGLSLAISATNDGDVPWLEVLKDIGGEALKILEKNQEGSGEKQSSLALEPDSSEKQSSPEPVGIKKSTLLEIPGGYSGLAYSSTGVYRFSVQEETLYTETRSYGIEGVEINCTQLREGGAKLLREIREAGLKISCVYELYDFIHREELDRAKAHVELAAEVGAEKVLIVPGFLEKAQAEALWDCCRKPEREGACGSAGEKTAEGCRNQGSKADEAAEYRKRNYMAVAHWMENSEAVCKIRETLRELVKYGSEKNVKITLEDFDNLTSPCSGMLFLEQVPGLGHTFDMGNYAYSGEDAEIALELLKPYIVHVHCKDRGIEGENKLAGVSVGSGYLPIREMTECLRLHGYKGYLAIEHFDLPDQMKHIRESAEFLNSNGKDAVARG